VDIAELERILAEHPWLPKPRYVFMVKERVYGVVDGMVITYRGATPIGSRDRMALTPDADDVTVVHELLHVAGLGEVAAYMLAPLIRAIRKRVPSIIKCEVKLRKVAQPHPSVEVYEVLY
jgi:hypothetical protein